MPVWLLSLSSVFPEFIHLVSFHGWVIFHYSLSVFSSFRGWLIFHYAGVTTVCSVLRLLVNLSSHEPYGCKHSCTERCVSYLTAFRASGILSDAEWLSHACNKGGSFLKWHLFTFKLLLSLFKMTFTCRGMSMHAAAYVCGGHRTTWGSWFSPSIPEVELRSWGLVAVSFTHWVILPAPINVPLFEKLLDSSPEVILFYISNIVRPQFLHPVTKMLLSGVLFLIWLTGVDLWMPWLCENDETQTLLWPGPETEDPVWTRPQESYRIVPKGTNLSPGTNGP